MDVDHENAPIERVDFVEPHMMSFKTDLNVNAKEFKPSKVLGKRRGKYDKNIFSISYCPENKHAKNVNAFGYDDTESHASTYHTAKQDSCSNISMSSPQRISSEDQELIAQKL